MSTDLNDRQLAAKMIWAAEQMKHAYQPAGLCIARVFCTERGIDPTPIERLVLDMNAVRGGEGTLEGVLAALVEERAAPAPDRLRGHPAIPVPPTVPERTAARFTGPTITPEETP